MTSPVYHAESSVALWGGSVENYLSIHQWFDQSKEHVPDIRHRALRHHSHGLFQCEIEFGEYITILRDGEEVRVPTRYVGEQHLIEDLGRVPRLDEWLCLMPIQSWMKKGSRVTNRLDITRGND